MNSTITPVSTPNNQVAQSKLQTLLNSLAMGRRVQDVFCGELARFAIEDRESLLAEIKQWFLANNFPHLFADHEDADYNNKCRDLMQRLITAVVIKLGRTHGHPPKYTRTDHYKVWNFWKNVCNLKYCPTNTERLNRKHKPSTTRIHS